MRTNTRNPQKTEGNDADRSGTESKQAIVALRSGAKVDVQHHFWSEDDTLLNVYVDSKTAGIDAQIPASNIEVVMRTATAADAFKRGDSA